MDRPNRQPAFNNSPDAHSFEELAAQQGVVPVEDFASLFGHPSEEDESADEFARMLREWRSEGVGMPSHR